MCRKRVRKMPYMALSLWVALMTGLLMVLASCAADMIAAGEDEAGENLITGIAVTIQKRIRDIDVPRAADDNDDLDDDLDTDDDDDDGDEDYEIVGDTGNGSLDYTDWNPDELTPYTLDFDENSVIQVSQKTRSINPFQTEDRTYSFQYMPGTDWATWDDENSYNFTASNPESPLEWNRIGEGGSWNGGFALFSLYFPGETSLRQKAGANGATLYSVMQDQSSVENLMKSDILGAYHTTPKLFSRIRFRLFHMMTYLRIRLYVPLYDEDSHTGYRENALESAGIINVTPDFAIDWDAIRSSDTQGPAVSPLDGSGEIIMYQHPLPDGEDKHKIMKIKYRDFLGTNYPFEQGIAGDYDKVRVYDFSVIIPLQKGMLDENGQQGAFANTEFLNFYFRTNSGALTRYYFTQELSANNNQSSLELNQGVYQYLQLYLPRVGNKAVCVGATVKPWDQMGTEMLLTPDDEDLQ